MAVARCPHCGTTNRAGSNYCNKCGVDLNAPEARPPAGAVSAPPDRRAASPPAPEPPSPASPPPAPKPAATPPQPLAQEGAAPDQPWLRVEFSEEEEEAPEAGPPTEEPVTGGRLITGVQGLLAPVRVAIRTTGDQVAPAPVPLPSPLDLQAEQIRHMRGLMSTDPPLRAGLPMVDAPALQPPLRRSWIILVLTLALGIPALFALDWPGGAPAAWPGVQAAWQTVENLPANAPVLVYWAYDPATAGEMDLVTLPVMQHLLQRRARIAVISPFPGGPATARRVLEQARLAWQLSERLTVAAETRWTAPIQYLPGGAGALALLGQAPVAAFTAATTQVHAELAETPALAVLAAADMEDAQQWLEQVQPLDQSPTIAITSAAADPFLRPYLDSAQLQGLVSGFDGAYHYQAEMESRGDQVVDALRLNRQVILQNWGQLAVIAIILIGNLAALLGR